MVNHILPWYSMSYQWCTKLPESNEPFQQPLTPLLLLFNVIIIKTNFSATPQFTFNTTLDPAEGRELSNRFVRVGRLSRVGKIFSMAILSMASHLYCRFKRWHNGKIPKGLDRTTSFEGDWMIDSNLSNGPE